MARLLAMAALCAVLPLGVARGSDPFHGTIEVPTVSTGNDGDLTLPARCAYSLDASTSQGVLGFVIPIAPADADGNHTFTLTLDGTPATPANVDVVFYENIGTCGGAVVVADQFQNEGNESGDVPGDALYALVLSRGALNVSFTFAIAPASPPAP